jgi:hypothetical protein
LMQSIVFLLENRPYFLKCIGFHSVQSLKKSCFGICCPFSFPCCHYSIFVLLNKSNN